MKYYIFDNEADALQYNANVSEKHNFAGVTSKWADVIAHPDGLQFAILASVKLELEDQTAIDGALPAEWFPTIDE